MVCYPATAYYRHVHVCFWRYCRYSYRRASSTALLYGGLTLLELFLGMFKPLFGYVQRQSECIWKSIFPSSGGTLVHRYILYDKDGHSVWTVCFNLYLLFVQRIFVDGQRICLVGSLLLLMLAGLGLGFGLLISSLTTKYRDLRFLITFGVQLWMYATPVIYPLSVMRQSHEQYMWIIVANPLTSIIETFKFGFLGVGTFSWFHLGYTLVFTVVIMLWGW